MKTFIANETLLLIEGEVYLLDINDRVGLDIKGIQYPVIASTKQLPNVKQLPREVFVKRVDVFNAYEQAKDNIGYNNYDNQFEYFQAGYYANKAEFTELQLAEALRISYDNGAKKEIGPAVSFYRVLEHLKSLTLPKQITTNDELEIISVSWE